MGTSDSCIATHPSDMAVAMRVLDAVVETIAPDGTPRSIPIAEFHRLPGDTPHIETTLKPGEMITAVVLPKPLGGVHIYRKVRDRSSYAFAVVSVAAVMLPGGQHRFAFGGLAHKPWRVEEAEKLTTPADIAGAVLKGARTTPQNSFKVRLLSRMVASIFAQAKAAP
jgi:xanthine dehydrogenase YagS FAD-binding subunit